MSKFHFLHAARCVARTNKCVHDIVINSDTKFVDQVKINQAIESIIRGFLSRK